MHDIVEQCKKVLENYYGAQFGGLIVYGSTARNDASPESDIDLLVLLHKPFDYFQELETIVDILYSVQMESERFISAKPAAVDEFERGDLQFYRNAKREGVRL